MRDVQPVSDGRAGLWQANLPAGAGLLLPEGIASRPVAPTPAIPPAEQALPPEIAALSALGVGPRTLLWALRRGRSLGVPAHRCLIAAGLISDLDYALAVGQRLNAPVVKEARLHPRAGMADALRHGWCRARLADETEVLLCRLSSPVLPALMRGRLAPGQSTVALATDADFQRIVLGHFAGTVSQYAATTVAPAQSARTGLTEAQTWLSLWLGCVLLPLALAYPQAGPALLPLCLGIAFLISTVVQLSACLVGLPDARPAVERRDHRLPGYSVLVPLYRESAIVPDLVKALTALDYPPEKLQVLLIVEEHDRQTQEALRAAALPAHIRMFIAPPGEPRTKPRAINAAMPFATGEMLVVYDAEDRPDPMQLRAAAAAFRRAGPDIACLQARLAIDHEQHTWLTRLFTIEYAGLFDVIKPGQARMALPVPLGGTSNHFRTDVLRRLGCWDAWNVTEDADLGIRLAAAGYTVGDLNSTTGEEAPVTVRAWLHQRARWLKGWMQTVITHTRDPLAAIRAMGMLNYVSAIALSLGVVVGIAFAPLFHGLALWRVVGGGFLAHASWLDTIADSVLIVLGSAGLLATFVPPVLGLIKRRRPDLLPWVVLLPVYHLLMAAAAWRAARELLTDRHGWNKTMHGIARAARRPLA